MEVGFFFWPFDVALVRAMAEAADTLGYDMVGIADTPGYAIPLTTGSRRARPSAFPSKVQVPSSARWKMIRPGTSARRAPRARDLSASGFFKDIAQSRPWRVAASRDS